MTIHSQDPRDPGRPDRRSGMSGTTIAALALGILLAIGVVWYVRANRPMTTVNSPAFERSVPDTTTGQNRTNVTPGRDQNIPNPSPTRSPAPAAQ